MAISAASLIFERWCLTGLDEFRTAISADDRERPLSPARPSLWPDYAGIEAWRPVVAPRGEASGPRLLQAYSLGGPRRDIGSSSNASCIASGRMAPRRMCRCQRYAPGPLRPQPRV